VFENNTIEGTFMKRISIVLIVCIAIGVVFSSGCTSKSPSQASSQVTGVPTVVQTGIPGGKTGLPNPASVYCVEQGGNLTIRKDAAGNEFGICNFPNGTSCEEWAFYRGECPLPGKAPVQQDTASSGNEGVPASGLSSGNMSPGGNLSPGSKAILGGNTTTVVNGSGK
jgi:putative hemolysin